MIKTRRIVNMKKYELLRIWIKTRGIVFFLLFFLIPLFFVYFIVSLLDVLGIKINSSIIKKLTSDQLFLMSLQYIAFFILFIIVIKRYKRTINFISKENWFNIMGRAFVPAILAFGFAVIFNVADFEAIKLEFSPQLGFGIMYTAIFATLATTALQTKYQKLVTPTKAGIVYSFEPIFAAVIAYMAIGERITTFGLIGASLIFLGLIISEIFDEIIKYLRKSV